MPVQLLSNQDGQSGIQSSLLAFLNQRLTVALLTIYDRCKAVDRGMTITDVKLIEKHGGKSGSYVAPQGS